MTVKSSIKFNSGIFESFLASHDPVYERPAALWEDGIPLGNSEITAMVWGEEKLNLTLNRLDVWEMRRYKPDPDKFKWSCFTDCLSRGEADEFKGILQTNDEPGPSPQQLPIGRVEVSSTGHQILDYHMRLHLYDGYASGYVTTEQGGYKWSCRVSAEHPLLVFRYETFGEEELSVRMRFSSVTDEYARDYTLPACRNKGGKILRGKYDKVPELSRLLREWGYPDPEFTENDGIHIYRQAIPENGDYAAAWTTIPLGGRENILLVSITSDPVNGRASDEALAVIGKYRTIQAVEAEYGEHKRWWNGFYPKSFFSLNDKKLESLYWIYIYQLGCWSRAEGIANPESGPWQPDDGTQEWLGNTYIWNTQQEMSFFECYTANRLECLKSTFLMLIDNRDQMKYMAEEFFGVEGGEFLPHMTDYKLGFPYYSANSFELLCGPWMMQMMWNYYRYSMDEEFLRDPLFSMMKAQCRVLMGVMEMGDDGRLHFPWSMSAEYPHTTARRKMLHYEGAWGKDSTCDLSYTIWMCETLLEAERILGITDEDDDRWRYTLRHIASFTYDEFGGLNIRDDMPYAISHRHLTHLFPITQNGQITYDSEEGKKIIDASMHALKVIGTGEWMGWTFSETGKLAIMMGQAPLAYSMIHEYADKFVYASGLDTDGSRDAAAFTYHEYNPGLSVESNGMFCDALQSFAVRCSNGIVHVLDVVPEELYDITFWHFRTEGAFLISAEMTDGRIRYIGISPEVGGEIRLITGLGSDISVTCCGDELQYKYKDGVVSFAAQKNKEYLITPKGAGKEEIYVIGPAGRSEHTANCFGLKRRGHNHINA